MGELGAFLRIHRQNYRYRPIAERVRDFKEYTEPLPEEGMREQGARCMDCGIPFCHSGCPLGNLIPDWNDAVYRGKWDEALAVSRQTNNFPEFTGRICPAPCEAACVLDINDDPVTIKMIEQAISDRAWAEGWVKPQPPAVRSGKRVAVVGSGPAGLAAAAELNYFGHEVTLFERNDRIGGLLRYGIPDFKLDKQIVDRRLDLMAKEGVILRPGVNVGVDVTADQLDEEGGERRFSAMTTELIGENGAVKELRGHEVGPPPAFEKIEGTDFAIPADLVLLAMGFLGPQQEGVVEQFGLELDGRGNVADQDSMSSRDGVFACGDARRGQSLVVWAIAEGRQCAQGVDRWLAEQEAGGELDLVALAG